ncbi:DUF7504 family protein [Halorientalis litorea]|uniref:DUF7504 family protein n=1 Tax=Halorientalis litorea TaxID=2931977 RepID=UPI001FF260FB|nr:hypothetical protein [Halorientalis litorea]
MKDHPSSAENGTVPFTPGTNVLAVDGTDRGTLQFSLSHLQKFDRRLLVSLDIAPKQLVQLATDADDESPTTVLDCTADSEPLLASEIPAETSVRNVEPETASVGEATIGALDQLPDGTTAGICVHSVPTLVERSTVQKTYKLLYVLAQRVRRDGHLAFYTWNNPTETRNLRILGRALDYRVTLDEADEPTVRSLVEVGEDG